MSRNVQIRFCSKNCSDLGRYQIVIRKMALTWGLVRLTDKSVNRGKTDRKGTSGGKPQTTRTGTRISDKFGHCGLNRDNGRKWVVSLPNRLQMAGIAHIGFAGPSRRLRTFRHVLCVLFVRYAPIASREESDMSVFTAEIGVNFAEAHKMLTELGISDIATSCDLFAAKYGKVVRRCHITQNGLVELNVLYVSSSGTYWYTAKIHSI